MSCEQKLPIPLDWFQKDDLEVLPTQPGVIRNWLAICVCYKGVQYFNNFTRTQRIGGFENKIFSRNIEYFVSAAFSIVTFWTRNRTMIRKPDHKPVFLPRLKKPFFLNREPSICLEWKKRLPLVLVLKENVFISKRFWWVGQPQNSFTPKLGDLIGWRKLFDLHKTENWMLLIVTTRAEEPWSSG